MLFCGGTFAARAAVVMSPMLAKRCTNALARSTAKTIYLSWSNRGCNVRTGTRR
jgi:hypothetical protein